MTITKMVRGLKENAANGTTNKKRTLQDLPMFKVAEKTKAKVEVTADTSNANERLAEFKFTGEGVKRSRISAGGASNTIDQ